MNKKAVYLEVTAVLLVCILFVGIGAVLVRNVYLQAQNLDDPGKTAWSFEFSFSADDLKNLLPGETKPKKETTDQDKTFELKRIRVFAGGPKIPAAKDRLYQDKFSQPETQYVYVEINYRNAFYKQSDSELPIKVQYYAPDGRLLGENQRTAHPQKDWESALFIDKWGYEQPGQWQPGMYKAKVYFAETPAGEISFEILRQGNGKPGELL